MFGRRVLIGVALALCGLPTWALPVYLAFDWPSGKPASTTVQVHIYAVLMAVFMASNQENTVPVKADSGPDGSVLNLDQGVWLVQAFTDGYWSQGVEVTIGNQSPANARLAFWPAATLEGEIATAQGEPPPQSIEVRLTGHPASYGQLAGAQASSPPVPQSPNNAVLICPVQGGKWSCLGPAGLFDARLEVAGFAPRYDWGVRLKAAESSDLGTTALQRILSVSGRAVMKNGSAPQGPCRATLQPDAERGGGPDYVPDNPPPDEKTFTVPLNQQGYFQILGVMQGMHTLTVACDRASGFTVLHVQPNGETLVDPPLVLQELTLDIGLTPKTDPAGLPWKLTIDATSPLLRRIADTAAVAADGHWIRHGLMAGTYRVTVNGSDGMEWLKKDFVLSPDSGPLALQLAAVKVAGTVVLNDLPVRAHLLFSNQAGGDPVTLNSDDEGRFAGLLPIVAGAQDSTWVVEAHVIHPQTVRRILGVDVPTLAAGKTASLDLELPSIPVRGIVVSEHGKPQDNAQVTFLSAGSGYQTATTTDETGSFEMADLPAGSYTATAQSSYGVSDATPFNVTETTENHLKLILHPNLHIPIYVISKDQEPISDATVQVWLVPGIPHAMGHTGRDGSYTVTLPPGTAEIGLTVGASDYAITMIKMPVSSTPAPSQGDQPPSQQTVTLDADGGSLVLNYQPAEGTLDRSATLYLVHNGAIADAKTLDGWGTGQAGANTEGPANVDNIAPGDYSLCVVTDPSQLSTLWQGTVPQDSCSTGTLKQGQTLTLTPLQVLTGKAGG